MKLAAVVASMALAFAPLTAVANGTQAPLPGGVATSSIDLEDNTLIAAVIAAGGVLVIGAIVLIIANDDDGNPVITTTTTTN